MITLRQLQCFAALAETLHFRRAAEKVHLTQPAVSAQIAHLEDHLGVLLVERTRRTVLLTPVGRAVAERARDVLRDVGELEAVARQAQRPLSGTLRVGVLRTLGAYLLPHILPAMRDTYPDLSLYMREEPRTRLLDDLAHGDLDMVLLASAPKDDAHLTVLPMFDEPLWMALPLGHRLCAKQVLNFGDLAGEQLILLEFGDGLRDPALEICRAAGASAHPDFHATSLDTLRQMVATGLGASLLPALYVEAEARDDRQIAVRPFSPPAPCRSIDLVWRRTTSRTDEFRLVAKMIEDNLPKVVERRG